MQSILMIARAGESRNEVSKEKTLHERCKGKTSEIMGQHLCPGENESRMQTWDAVDIQNLVFQLSKKNNFPKHSQIISPI